MVKSIYIFIVYFVEYINILLCTSQQEFKITTVLIRKCCTEYEQLNSKYNACINFTETTSIGHGEKQKIVSDVITEEYPHFPWWMDSEVLPISPDTLTNVSSFLEGQNTSKYIEFGGGPPCMYSLTKLLSSKSRLINLLHNGSLVYRAEEQVNITFTPASFCTDLAEDGLYVYLLCSCLESSCVRKCCQENEILSNLYSRTCINQSEHFGKKLSVPTLYSSKTKTEVHTPYVLFASYVTCHTRIIIVSGFRIYDNTSVIVESVGRYSSEKYCWDMSIDNSGITIPSMEICVPAVTIDECEFYSSLSITAIIFLVLSLIVFFTVPTMGKCIRNVFACHIISQIVGYFALILYGLQTYENEVYCLIFPFITLFSFHASFFWMNVMCIDISWTFSGIRPPRGGIVEQDHKKFLYYSLYAWGVPLLIATVTGVMEYAESIPDTYIKPGFYPGCWFGETIPRALYYYLPMGAVLVVNLILFVYTTVRILLVQRETRVLYSVESSRHEKRDFKKNKEMLMLCGKLFCLMGLTWMFDMFWWEKGGGEYYWLVINSIHLVRAVVLFILFSCKRKVFRMLKQRLQLGSSNSWVSEEARSTAIGKYSCSTRQN